MTEHHLISLVGVIVLGVAAQWLAWRLGLPSILLLLLIGIVAGPVTLFLRPDALLGEALVPIVSLSVAVILFEGGLSLKVRELLAVGKAVRNLVTVGAAITWGLTTISGRYIHLAGRFGRSDVYQLSTEAHIAQKGAMPRHLRGRILFDLNVNHEFLTKRFADGSLLKSTVLTHEFGYEGFKSLYGSSDVPMFLVSETGQLRAFTLNNPPIPRPGQKLISLVDPIGSDSGQSLSPVART